MIESTALGAAVGAALGAGFYNSLDEVRAAINSELTIFDPKMDAGRRAKELRRWAEAVEKTLELTGKELSLQAKI